MTRYPLTIPPWLYGVGLDSTDREIVALLLAMSTERACRVRAPWIAERLDIPRRTTYTKLDGLKARGWIWQEEGLWHVRRPEGAPETCRNGTGDVPIQHTKRAVSARASKVLVRDSSHGVVVAESHDLTVHESPRSAAAALQARLELTLETALSAAPDEPVDCPETATLPPIVVSEVTTRYVETPPEEDLALTASDEVRAAATELCLRGVDGEAPLVWARRKSLKRVLEVCAWADRQRWRGDPARCPREIVAALREGYGTAPLSGTEAERVEAPKPPSPEERERKRREALFRAFRIYGIERARTLHSQIPEPVWLSLVREWQEEAKPPETVEAAQAAAVRAIVAGMGGSPLASGASP